MIVQDVMFDSIRALKLPSGKVMQIECDKAELRVRANGVVVYIERKNSSNEWESVEIEKPKKEEIEKSKPDEKNKPEVIKNLPNPTGATPKPH